MFFSTFEPIDQGRDSVLQRNEIPMLYERVASQLPTLYVCPVEIVLGRVPREETGFFRKFTTFFRKMPKLSAKTARAFAGPAEAFIIPPRRL